MISIKYVHYNNNNDNNNKTIIMLKLLKCANAHDKIKNKIKRLNSKNYN